MSAEFILSPTRPLPVNAGEEVRWGRAYGCAAALAIAEISARADHCVLAVTGSASEAELLYSQMQFFRGDDAGCALLPDLEVLPYDSFSPHQDLTARRLQILRRLDNREPLTILAAAPTLLPRLPPATYLQTRGIALRCGQTLDPEDFRRQLDDAGYQRVSQVSTHGDYAVRGSLVDFFPTGHEIPFRVDFLDDEIESIREFDPDSQLSTGTRTELDTLPARAMPVDEQAVMAFRQSYRRRFEGNPARALIYREISEGRVPGGIENYLPLFFPTTATIWDYVPEETLVICMADPDEALQQAWRHVQERYEQNLGDQERPPLAPEELHVTPADHRAEIGKRRLLWLESREIPAERLTATDVNLPVSVPPPVLISRHDEQPAARLAAFIRDWRGRTLFTADSPGRREMLGDLLRREGLTAGMPRSWQEFVSSSLQMGISIAPLERGALVEDPPLAILSEQELFGEAPRPRRRRRRVQDPEALINDLTDLRAGAPVVHAEHGVGRYIGLTILDIEDMPTEFLSIEYAGGDRLHVPVSSMHLVSRYTGGSPEHAPLHRLGSDQWARARHKAAEKIRDVAAELLDLYARRAARMGQSSRIDERDYRAFAAGFPFVPTEDQARAIEEVLGDLSSSQPMDRLVCGDVGFGKTEVALRAAFVAVENGRQVAVLVPTTLLAQQHYQTFIDRLAEWPVNVEMLSRFRSQSQSRRILEGLANGSIDVVIGTHRLLQPTVRFKNLGLVIIDEEHRFGVRHKERLKTLRTEVDMLTLTATPIPRTLNMALGSLRELSLIATPPESRLSIKTFVTEWSGRIIREACLRELKRGGQVYFVHNRIEDIERVAAKVAELVPEGKLEIAHGQMRERDLERIMQDFYHRRFQILVCTAIIESGLDVPSANTIIIDRADRFGLAQLHQLRGRVGRSHHQAFAYLIAPPRHALTADAVKRLEAIESLEDLGAGFILATHDLEIRGAGELLGEEQSGQIQEIGFSLYNEILSRTIESLRSGLEPDIDTPIDEVTEINLHLPALLPEDYLPDVHLRLVHYKRIANAGDARELEALQIELIDRFGLLPPAAQNLFRLTMLRLKAAPLSIRRLDLGSTGGSVEFGRQTAIDPAALVQLIESQAETYRLDRDQRLRIRAALPDVEERFCFAETLVSLLGNTEPARARRQARAGSNVS
jgi:transcription-repair coupling factor (superfamily II helicase)